MQTDHRRLIQRTTSGFTLIEVLVALVITGLLVSILVSALYYMFRVQDSLHGEVVTREKDLRAKAWFADAVASCLAIDANGGTVFSGAATEIRCESTAALQPGYSGVPALIVFTLKRGQADQILLSYQEPARKDSQPHVVAEWLAGEANFRYVNTQGEEMDRWPKDKTNPETLPRLVKLTVKSSDNSQITWIVAMRNDPWLEPVPKLPFGMELLK